MSSPKLPFTGPVQPQDTSQPPPINAAQVGLSGGLPMQNSQPAAPATQAEEPEPHESVARHIIDALGGGSGKPGDWARGIIAGGLAAAANVGKVPEGGGALYGAAKAAQGHQEIRRQQEQDIQRANIQNQEMQLRQKADARAEQELQIHLEDTKVQRAMWNAQTAASIANQQRLAAEFPNQQKETQLKIKQLSDQITQSEQDQLAVLSAAGVDVSKLEHITSYDQLTSSHAKDAASGGIFAVPNGQEHKEGEDGAGAYIVPGNVWEQPITKPVTITTGYEIDKNGKAIPKTTTAQEGTTVGTLLAIAKGAQMDLANKQKQIMDQASIQKEQAQTREANASAAKNEEETRQLKTFDTGNLHDAFGEKVGAPGMDKKEFVKRVDTYNKDYTKDLNQLDKAYNQLDGIIKNAEATGKLPGADAVVGIFDAIGLSSEPLKGRGFRINGQVIGEHVEGTRNAWQGLGLKLARLTPKGTGQIVTLQQLKDYERIMQEARHDAYVGAGNVARNQGIGVQSIPRGNNSPIDPNTMDIFLTLSGGDANKAATVAKQYGWTPPAQR